MQVLAERQKNKENNFDVEKRSGLLLRWLRWLFFKMKFDLHGLLPCKGLENKNQNGGISIGSTCNGIRPANMSK